MLLGFLIGEIKQFDCSFPYFTHSLIQSREKEMRQVWKSIAKEALDKTYVVAAFLSTLHVTNTYLLTTAYSMGPSMLPTFHLTGNLILAERISPRFGKIRNGDIVLVRSPEIPRKCVTKRVRAMEGDEITYLIDPKNSDIQNTIIVPKGHVWIEGDNTYDSHDSKNFGPVPYGLIQGKIFWRILPLKSFGPLR